MMGGMAVTVVWDDKHRQIYRRLGRGATILIGDVFVLVAIAASIPFFLSTLVAFMVFFGNEPSTQFPFSISRVWIISAPVTVLGYTLGLRVIRGKRKLVLFLRRFGYSEGAQAVSFATHAIGRSWRLVTLDDAQIAAVGVPRILGATHAADWIGTIFKKVANVVWLATSVVFPTAAIVELAICVLAIIEDYSRHDSRIMMHLFEGKDAISIIFRSLGYILLRGSLLILAYYVAASVIIIIFGPINMFFGRMVDDAREADKAKTARIRNRFDIDGAVEMVHKQSRKIFSPRLVVLTVDSLVWQQTVSRLAELAAVPLIDVSEPTPNLLWEIEQFGSRAVYVIHSDRVCRLCEQETIDEPGYRKNRLLELLDGREVLAYHTDRRGLRRFACTLRARLDA